MIGAVRPRGEIVGRCLAGAWRRTPPPLAASTAELREVAPMLLGSGSAGLVWRRLRDQAIGKSPDAERLRQAYRLHSLQAAVHRRELRRILAVLRAAGVEPLLVKGWVVAQWYPEPGLRPYGDFDLCVRPDEVSRGRAALARAGAAGGKVDLHCGLRMLDDRRLDDLYDRSARIDAGGFVVRTLGREDHLRYLCLHALGHGAWRPLWLCDLGAGLEASPGGLDWDRILSGDARRTGLVICALTLAHRLLGARPEGAPAVAEARLPRWLISSTLREWGRPKIAHGNRTPMVFYMRRPAGLLAALRTRWPSPTEASVGVGAPFDELPRLPFQLAECVSRTARFAARVPALIAGSIDTPAGGR